MFLIELDKCDSVGKLGDCNSLQDEEPTGKTRLAVILDNMSTIQKMLIDDNLCIYQMIQKELDTGSAATDKIIHTYEKNSLPLSSP
ncbi:hypothetical protein TNCV_2095141 [Trichonephila clavipes]|nr:hypothetical protein TNCV_2095141 [Trichonephila clavipes]